MTHTATLRELHAANSAILYQEIENRRLKAQLDQKTRELARLLVAINRLQQHLTQANLAQMFDIADDIQHPKRTT